MSEHLWLRENLSDYVAGCLDAEEFERAERHLAECAECTAEVDRWLAMDEQIDRLFVGARPRPGLEDRLIQSLRTAKPQRRRIPWLTMAACFATPIFLGLLGYGLYNLGEVPLPGNASLSEMLQWGKRDKGREAAKENLKKIALASHSFHGESGVGSESVGVTDDNAPTTVTSNRASVAPQLGALPRVSLEAPPKAGRRDWLFDDRATSEQNGERNEWQNKNQPMASAAPELPAGVKRLVTGFKAENALKLHEDSDQFRMAITDMPKVGNDRMAGHDQDRQSQGLTADMELKEAASRKADESAPVFGKRAYDRGPGSALARDKGVAAGSPMGQPGYGKSPSIANGGNAYPAGNVMTVTGGTPPSSTVTGPPTLTSIAPNSGPTTGGTLTINGTGLSDTTDFTIAGQPSIAYGSSAPMYAPMMGGMGQGGGGGMNQPRGAMFDGYAHGTNGIARNGKADPKSLEKEMREESRLATERSFKDGGTRTPDSVQQSKPYFKNSAPAVAEIYARVESLKKAGEGRAAEKQSRPAPPAPPAPNAKATPPGGWGIRSPWQLAEADQPKDQRAQDGTPPAKVPAPGEAKPSAPPKAVKAPEPEKEQPPEVTAPPKNDGRKIIRTGEMEFEVDSFDNAVGTVTRLMNKIQGGFVSTINSEKLPNGKVRGSVVVRMPPEYLDRFVWDLRKDLGKSGELKLQRIGSQDITKQYTDVESRLKAARAMEERLLNIIKNGKGEVKDLLAAERELGTWRTKIEEMVGELRYYGNQVALSTLTITLYEREIASPAAFVINETVHMNIMTEDVEKAQKAALTAVADLKGRVTRSDLKQQPDGQLSAKLILQVPHDKADEMRARLAKLGDVASQDSQRNQGRSVDGGLRSEENGPPLDVKARFNNVQFDVELYNLSHIKARETFNIDVAARDVAGAYTRLRTAVLKCEGQNVTGTLNEQDRLNVNAKLEFSIFTLFQDNFDKLLAEQGDLVSRSTAQVPPSEAATNRKVGYVLNLLSLDNIAARETLTLKIATKDPAADYRKLRDEIAKLDGRIRSQQLNEQDLFNINATLEFSVPATARAEFDKLLAGLGDTVAHSTNVIAANQPASDRKVGYSLTLLSLDNIAPRETLVRRIVARDPTIGYHQLQEEVVKAGGKVRSHVLNDADPYNVGAALEFSVPTAKRAEFDKLLAELGDTITHSTVVIPANQPASDRKVGYTLTLDSLDKIQARESFSITLAGSDVSGSFHKLREAVLSAKGRVYSEILNETDKLNVSAALNVVVFAENRAEFEKLLADQGDVIARNTTRAPANQPATERKFVYSLSLENLDKILAKDTYSLVVACPDVAAAFTKLRAAVVKGKGRIFVEQLKEHEKPFVSGILEFKVFKEQRKEIEDLLADAGEVINRTTMAQAVNQITSDRKVAYSLKLDSLDSIPPREINILHLAGPDVKAAYLKVRAAVLKDKGRIFSEQLKEHEKPYPSASLEFKIFANDRANIEKLLPELGEIVNRSNYAMDATKITTDRKIGYVLRFDSLDSIPPREVFNRQVAGPDVPEMYDKLKKAVLKAKGRILADQLKRLDNLNVTAVLDFYVPAEQRDEFKKLLEDIGETIASSTVPVPPNATVTDRMIGYRLDIRNANNIKPRETVYVEVSTRDLPGSFLRVREEVNKAKGQVRSGEFKEQDRTRLLIFDVPVKNRAEVDGLLAQVGQVTKRDAKPVPADEPATERKIGFHLTLQLDATPPREAVKVRVASQDVAGNYRKLREEVVKGRGQILKGELMEQDALRPEGRLEFDVPASQRETIDRLLADMGDTVAREIVPVAVAANEATTDQYLRYQLSLVKYAALPREKVNVEVVDVADVKLAVAELTKLATDSKGDILAATVASENGVVSARFQVLVPMTASAEMSRRIQGLGEVKKSGSEPDPHAPNSDKAQASFDVVLIGTSFVSRKHSLGAQVRNSFYLIFLFLTWILVFILLCLCVLLPWAVLIWATVKIVRKLRAKPKAAA